MLRALISACLLLPPLAAAGEILVTVRTIRAREIIAAADIVRKPGEIDGAASDPGAIIGQEARFALYPGRPIRAGDVGPPAIVERNDVVAVFFSRGGLRIATEGRALGRGAAGDTVRVMNLSSRATVRGRVMADGSIEVR